MCALCYYEGIYLLGEEVLQPCCQILVEKIPWWLQVAAIAEWRACGVTSLARFAAKSWFDRSP